MLHYTPLQAQWPTTSNVYCSCFCGSFGDQPDGSADWAGLAHLHGDWVLADLGWPQLEWQRRSGSGITGQLRQTEVQKWVEICKGSCGLGLAWHISLQLGWPTFFICYLWWLYTLFNWPKDITLPTVAGLAKLYDKGQGSRNGKSNEINLHLKKNKNNFYFLAKGHYSHSVPSCVLFTCIVSSRYWLYFEDFCRSSNKVGVLPC